METLAYIFTYQNVIVFGVGFIFMNALNKIADAIVEQTEKIEELTSLLSESNTVERRYESGAAKALKHMVQEEDVFVEENHIGDMGIGAVLSTLKDGIGIKDYMLVYGEEYPIMCGMDLHTFANVLIKSKVVYGIDSDLIILDEGTEKERIVITNNRNIKGMDYTVTSKTFTTDSPIENKHSGNKG